MLKCLHLLTSFLFAVVLVAGCGSVQSVKAAAQQGPAGPPGPVGPQGPPGPQGIQGPTGNPASPFLQGRKFGVEGDSLSALFNNAWQNVVVKRTGMTLVTQDARSGRSFATAFECWGQPAVGGTLGTFQSTYTFPGVGGSCGGSQNTGLMDGETFAASLANTDVQIIELGTNDEDFPLGQLGDSTTARTFYGNMRWVVETYLQAKPTLRLFLVTVQYNGLATSATAQTFAAATEAYGNSVGVPVINMYKRGGVNAITAGSLLRDGTHPSDFGFANFYGPVIAQGLQQNF